MTWISTDLAVFSQEQADAANNEATKMREDFRAATAFDVVADDLSEGLRPFRERLSETRITSVVIMYANIEPRQVTYQKGEDGVFHESDSRT